LSDNYVRLAQEFQKRNNPVRVGICVGEVTSLTPVNIRIYYNGTPFDFTEFFNFKSLINGGTGVTTGELYVKEYPVNIGDKFICIAGNDNQCLYVLGKFESIEDLYIYLEE
jgi:hypothetical protein